MNLLEQMNSDLGIDVQYIKFCSQRNGLYAQYYIPKNIATIKRIKSFAILVMQKYF